MASKPTYDSLIKPNGQPQYGCHTYPPAQINYWDFDYQTTADKPASAWRKHFDFKQFQFIGLYSERYILCAAIANIQYLAHAFVYLFDQQDGSLIAKKRMRLFARGCDMQTNPQAGISYFRTSADQFSFRALDQGFGFQLDIHLGGKHIVHARLAPPSSQRPLCLCTPTGYNGWTYTQKSSGLTCSGHIQWQDHDIVLETEQFTGSYDWSCGYLRHQTAWNWLSASGKVNNQLIGINLAAGVNETGTTENTIWINSKMHRLAPVTFRFNRHQRIKEWVIRSEDSRLNCRFTPLAQYVDKRSALLLATNFNQLPGKLSGSYTDQEGNVYLLDGLPGVVEDHYAKW